MLLHNDNEKFIQIVTDVFNATGVRSPLVEKDYFIALFLKYLTTKEPLLVFKGGTCLSKCFKLINRFSEDIDINLDGVKELSQSRKKQLKQNIISVIDELELTLSNPEQIKSDMDYNLYKVLYPTAFSDSSLKQHLEVESVFRIEVFPTAIMPVTSFIYDFLKERGADSVITEYGLEPFDIRVQTLERTFVDKIFAICDYYFNGRTEMQSRHIYDLYKILPHMTLDNKLKAFVEEVRQVREGRHDCPSANKGVSLHDIISNIISEKTYKKDYNDITALLLYETVSYNEVITAIQKIADWLK